MDITLLQPHTSCWKKHVPRNGSSSVRFAASAIFRRSTPAFSKYLVRWPPAAGQQSRPGKDSDSYILIYFRLNLSSDFIPWSKHLMKINLGCCLDHTLFCSQETSASKPVEIDSGLHLRACLCVLSVISRFWNWSEIFESVPMVCYKLPSVMDEPMCGPNTLP